MYSYMPFIAAVSHLLRTLSHDGGFSENKTTFQKGKGMQVLQSLRNPLYYLYVTIPIFV